MKIQLKKGPRAAFEEIEVEKGTTIEAIYKKIERELPYKILLAKVNYEYEGLDYEIRQECSVELLDMRVQAASLVYQSSLSLLYLKAIHDVLGAVDVDIDTQSYDCGNGDHQDKSGQRIFSQAFSTQALHEFLTGCALFRFLFFFHFCPLFHLFSDTRKPIGLISDESSRVYIQVISKKR